MAETVETIDVEDVLSSVRRLVSEDHRTVRKPEAAVAADADRLVLTPALRVAEAVEASSEPEQSAADAGPMSLESKIAALEAAIGRRADNWEPDGSEMPRPQSWEDVTGVPFVHHEPEELGADAEDAEVLDEPEIDLEAGAAPEPADAVAEPEPAADAVELADMVAPEEPGDRKPGQPAEEDQEAHEEEEPETLAAMETAETPEDDDFETLLADAPEFDDEALRDIVGRIVREELQGALGERITRNVRKLVRREIHRVLASYEIDD